jgi:hypothetical protein
MERSGFPETIYSVPDGVYQLFREWSGADFPKLSNYRDFDVSGMERSGFPETI